MTPEEMKNHGRYPYTFAYDYLRVKVGHDYDKGILSRAAMSRVTHEIADACGMDHRAMAHRLADLYIEENAA